LNYDSRVANKNIVLHTDCSIIVAIVFLLLEDSNVCDKKEIPLNSFHTLLDKELVDISIILLKLQIEFLKINKMDYDSFMSCAEKKVAFLHAMSSITNSSELRKHITEVLKEYEGVLRN
jgi:hypothetical protein